LLFLIKPLGSSINQREVNKTSKAMKKTSMPMPMKAMKAMKAATAMKAMKVMKAVKTQVDGLHFKHDCL